MALSNDLISQFVKITKDEKKPEKETTAYGEVTNVEYIGDKITNVRVRLDGASEDTPIASTTDVIVGDRVIVMIKNHTAVITGNITSPSARTEVVRRVVTTVTKMDDVIADKVSAEDLAAESARIDSLEADNVVVRQKLEATEADISALEADSLEVHETLRANDADIKYLKANIVGADQVEATFATIEMLRAAEADIDALEADQAEFESATVQELEAQKADIQELEAKKLSATDIEGKYANIDFSNISKATMQWFYANSGLIEDVIVGDGQITGKLVGVTIIGDLIEGGTVKAEKLVIKGTDGLYYKLNTDGVKTEAEQTEYNSINGSVILAKSITATKISVDDLVAFDATIGGFSITDNSLYSGVKSTVNNTARGIYLDSTGQMAVGDASNFIKYYKDSTGAYKLEISADSLTFGSSKKSVEAAINDVQTSVDNIQVGGRNLLENSSFEGLSDIGDDTYSVVYSPSEKMITLTANTVNSTHVPARYTKLTEYGRTNINGSKLTLSGEYRVLTDLQFGTTNPWVGYQLSIARDETTGGSSQWINWVGGTALQTTASDKWIKYSNTYDITEYDAVSVGVSILFRNTSGSIQFRNLKVEFGNKPTDWTAAPEDLEKVVSEAKNVDIGGRNYIITDKLSSYSVYNSTPICENGVISTSYNSSYAPATASYLTLKVDGYIPPKDVMTLSGYIKVNGEIPGSDFFTTRASTYGPEATYRYFDPLTGYFVCTQSYDGESDWIIHAQTVRTAGSSDVITFEKLKFEKGNKPTDWSPAPEDMATAIDVENVASTASDAQNRVADTEALIEILSESISMLVTDGNGASLMTQTENGWTFSTGDIQDLVNRTSEALEDLTREVGDTTGAVDILQQAVDDLGTIAEYIKIGTYENEPCIELGESDSDFKLRITNTRMIFTEGSNVLAYFNNQSLHIKKAVVEEELQQGGFAWKIRSNGNLALIWKGDDE